MPISLPSTTTPRGLRSTYATDEENAAAAEAMQQDAIEANTSFGRGLSRGLYQMPAMMANAAGQIVEPLSQPTAQPMFDWAAQQNQAARQLVSSQDVTSYDQVNSPGTLASYVGGAIGENLPNMIATLPLGIAGRVGLRGAAMSPFAKNLAATSAASFPMQMGEMAGSLREDPTIMANTTPLQRLGTSAGYAALTAPMEAADEALLMGRAMGAGKVVKNIFNDGVGATAKSALGHVAKAIPEAALTEGVPEVGQTFTQQQMLNGLNPERDTSKDQKELGDSFFKGWAAGAGSSVAGRGADVAWAQGRGATEAIRSLLTPKTLPPALTQSDDQTIVDWDKQDDQQRNGWAKDLADKILNSDASQSLKEAATSFYDKASQGASDAWSSLSDALGDNQHVQQATGRLDNFLEAVKKANKNAFGGKFNAESTPEDQAMFEQLTQYLDPKGVAARDTEKKSDLFQGIKGALQAEAWHELPWNELEDEFGTIGRATEAVVKMRENMVRAGQLEHDDEFGKLLEASAKDGQLGERAMMDVVHRYGKEYIGRKPQDSELREVVRGIRNAMQSRSSMKPEMIKAFDAEMNKTFGEGNAVKVMQALGPKNVETTEFENDDGEGVKVGDEIDTPKAGFIGSSVQHQRKVAADGNAESTIANHGGFWRLDKKGASPAEISALKEQVAAAGEAVRTAKAAGRGTANLTKKLNNLTKKLDATMDKTAVQQMRKRYNDTAASLRKGQGADSHYVRSLTPLEYAEAAGIAPSKVAKHLGTTVEGLQDHPARMLMAEPRQLEKDKLSLDKDDIKNLADATQEAVGRMPASILLKGGQAEAVKAAMKLSGREQRKAMEALGLEHGQRMDDKVANKLVNNWHHGGNGVFTVHMDDGTNFKISAQALIATMRKRAVGEMGDRSALKAFQSGVAALQNIEGFSKITVDSVWGKQQAPAKNSVGKNGKSVANAQYGVFGPYFKLEPGLTLAAANDAATRKGSKAEKDDLELVKKYENLETVLKNQQKAEVIRRKGGLNTDGIERAIDNTLTAMEALKPRYDEIENARATYSGEDQTDAVPGERGAITDEESTETQLDHADEDVLDFNDDGTRKHSPESTKPLTKQERELAKAKSKDARLTGLTAEGLTKSVKAKDAAKQAKKEVETLTAEVDELRAAFKAATSVRARKGVNAELRDAEARLFTATNEMERLQALADASTGLATKEEAAAAEQKLTEMYAQLTDTPVGTEVLNRAPLKFNGVTLQLGPGVSGKDLTGPARKLLSSVRRMRELLGNTSNSDIVLNIVAQAAAANHASDAKAREALLAMASDKLVQSLADEMVLTQETAQGSEGDAKQMLRERYAELKKLGSEHIALSKKYQANQEAYDQYAASYQPYRGGKPKKGSTFESTPDRWSHHQQFLATLEGKSDEEITNDGKARLVRLSNLYAVANKSEKLDQLIKLMEEEQALAREELRARKAGTKVQKVEAVDAPTARPDPVTPKAGPAAAERKATEAADEGRRIAAEKHQKEFDAALDEVAPEAEAKAETTDIEKLQNNLAETAKHLRGAWAALKKSYVDGKFDKALVPQLRAALASFRAAAGDATRIVAQAVQRFIKEYQAAMKGFDANAEFGKMVSFAATLFNQGAAVGRDYYNSLFSETTSEQGTQSKLVARLARKFKGEFTTGFETKVRGDDIAGLGSYTTHMVYLPEAGQYQFMVVPDVIVSNFIKDFAQRNEMTEAQAAEKINGDIEKNPSWRTYFSILGGSFTTKTSYIGIQSAFPGSTAEKFLNERGLLGKETGTSGTEWNVLKGLQPNILHASLGEFYARLQAVTGTEEVKGNWNRDTGANKRTKKAHKLNAEGSNPTGVGVTAQDMAEVKGYIAKVLGPKVKVLLAKTLGGNSASWERVNGDVLIKIAAKAANPMSKAHHEAMHEFFQRLMDDGSPAADILRQAANNPLVTRQIEQFFHNEPNYAKIKAALAADEHERVAYMFQLWAAGKLTVGPKTKSWFQKIKDFLRKVSGVLSSDQKAEAIMEHFHEGSMSDTNAVAAVLANDPKLIQDLVERSDKLMGPLSEKLQELMYTSQNILIESGNAGFEKIGRMFSNETGSENKGMSFFDAKTMKTNQMNDRLVQILKGADEKDIAAALEGLQTGKQSNDPKIAAMQQRVRKMLDQIHTYLKDAGVDVAKVKDYFPRAWDVALISDDKAGFIKLLQADHLKNTGKPLSDTIATGIADTLILNRGADPLNEDELEAGYTPFMAAANKRVLDFITDPAFAKFQQQDMPQVLTNYIAQGVHRAEYTRRFGSNGKGLRSMIHDAVGEAVGPEWATARTAADDKLTALKKSLKASGATQAKISETMHKQGYRYGEVQTEHIVAELADKTKFNEFEPKLRRNVRAIMAMEGTLGADISPRLRKLSSTLIVYENMRLLGMSLFSQVIDPLGVLVRGGTLNNAFETFKRGIVGTIAAWKGTPMDDKMSELAMKLGIIDASGMMNSQGNAYASVYLGKTAQKWNDRLFRVNGVEGFSQGTRVGAMIAAIEFLKHHSTLPSEHSERWLAELNLKAADIVLVGGELDYQNPKIQQALFRWVETAVLRPNASMRPAWASDPHFSLIFHMKQFTYAMQKVILERVHNEIKHGNYDPAIAMVLTYVPAMMAADFLRGIAANGGEEPPWKRKWDFGDYLASGVQRAGLLGVPQFALDVAEWGPGELAGPAAEQVIRAGERLNKDVARDMRLDDVAALTGASRDIQKAEDFNGVSHAAKRTLRDALPINSLTKRYVFDEIAGT